MKRSIRRAAAGAALTAALAATAIPTASAAESAPGRAATATPATVAAFGRLAEAVLAQRTAALVDHRQARTPLAALTADARAGVGLAAAEARSENAVDASLQTRRARLRAAGEAYRAGSTAVTVDRVRISGHRADVLVTETTTLTYEKLRGDEPPTTGFQAQHEATFVATPEGHWQLTGLTDLDTAPGGPGVPQVNEPTPTGFDTPAPAAAHLAVHVDSPLAKLTDPPQATAASTAWPAAPRPKPAKSGTNDYTAMAAYAETYWSHYNPAYRQFNGAGGDCTNFISQSLKAGGWQFASGWASDYDHTWWYSATNPATQSWSWNGVNEWSWYALSSRRVTNLPDVYQLGVGDILQMDFDRDGSKDHSMIVTYRSGSGMPYVTYHSTNTLNRSVASLVSVYPDAYYYAYRT
ncbi:amidase domain-containing protein [Streptacidiphilus pinicola]|uniref:amidase domain-containing protein n=1 Tax=Streptacidiphilus pinicola TaxID=2219663 RepID=UPI001FB54361|nr:amidase domain-containing protein [Streptacidiphilus pinicola]